MKRTLLVAVGLLCSLAAHAQVVETVVTDPSLRDYLVVSPSGDVYVSNQDDKIQKVTPDGTVSNVASGLNFVTGLALSPSGTLYASNSNEGAIVEVGEDGSLTEIVSGIDFPTGIVYDTATDELIVLTYGVAETTSSVYRVGLDGSVDIIADGVGRGGAGLAMDENGMIYTGSFTTGLVERVTPDGDVTALATVNPRVGYLVYAAGSLFVTTYQGHEVVRVDPDSGEITPFAGTGAPGNTDGPAATAQFRVPNGIGVDATGTVLYVSSDGTGALRRITGVQPVASEDEATLSAVRLEPLYPNPMRAEGTVRFALERSASVMVDVADVLGRRVRSVRQDRFASGVHAVPLDVSGLAPGVYVLRLRTETDVLSQTFTIVR